MKLKEEILEELGSYTHFEKLTMQQIRSAWIADGIMKIIKKHENITKNKKNKENDTVFMDRLSIL